MITAECPPGTICKGNAVPTDSQAVQAGAIQILNTITQALPTGGSQALATTNAVPVPTNPMSPLQVIPAQPLAVVNPNQYSAPGAYPAPKPFYKNPYVIAPAAVGLIGLGMILFWPRSKRK
jgi:hypothetical protein